MKPVYDIQELLNLTLLKEASHWHRQKFISTEQWTAIRAAYPCKLYHPNVMIRILLFIATWVAISGGTGLFFMVVMEMTEILRALFAITAGVAGFYFARILLVENSNHFRSGVVEAVIYSSAGFIFGGTGFLTDWNPHLLFLTGIGILIFCASRFLDWLCTALAVLTVAGFLFYECFELGGIFRQIIPLVIIFFFSGIYFLSRDAKRKEKWATWEDNLLIVEVLCLLLIYAGGNYLVVRECSVEMLNMSIAEGEDIPMAIFFYAFTAMLPIILLYRGVQLRSIMLLRVGVGTLVLSVLTFRHYYSIAPPEIALTFGGAIILGATAWLYSFLRTPRGGFTRKKLLSRDAVGRDLTAFAISQSMGGNVQKPDETFKGSGGTFGGGGSSGSF